MKKYSINPTEITASQIEGIGETHADGSIVVLLDNGEEAKATAQAKIGDYYTSEGAVIPKNHFEGVYTVVDEPVEEAEEKPKAKGRKAKAEE